MIDYNIDGMNKKIVEANTKLVDENRWLKDDIEKLKIRINRAKKYIESHKDNVQWTHRFGNDLIDILEGRYFEEI